jgi:dolichyl-phosphate-mannose-protein mannosyltransferase
LSAGACERLNSNARQVEQSASAASAIGSAPVPWTSRERMFFGALMLAAATAHFWRLGHPAVLVYDENIYVDEACRYLSGRQFFEIHPPLTVLAISACMRMFGERAAAWRLPNALIGTALIAVTYLLGREMFRSRVAAGLASILILSDGLYLTFSRLALANIDYVTAAAIAYLMLFRLRRSSCRRAHRRTLAWLGLALGACLASKFAIPGVTALLAGGFLIVIIAQSHGGGAAGLSPSRLAAAAASRQGIGALLLVGGLSAAVYLTVFIPQFLLGWWSGMGDLIRYYTTAMDYNHSPLFPAKSASPWWSWPLMLRAYFYVRPRGAATVAAIWGGGNPAVCWGALAGIAVAAVRALRTRELPWTFLALGYAAYMAMWVPVGRPLYGYSYVAPLYLGVLALAATLADCWRGDAERWEHALVMLAIAPVLIFGLGETAGSLAAAACVGGYIVAARRFGAGGKLVCGIYVIVASLTFLYFLPIWIAWPVSPNALAARMWLHRKGSLFDWQ